MIALKSPENDAKVCLATQKQIDFRKLDRSEMMPEDFDWANLQKHNTIDHTFPKSIVFEWEGACEAELLFWEEEGDIQTISCVGGKAEVINLKIATTYFWAVKTADDQSETFSFQTEDIAPRWIRVDGTTNVRDCGGWKTTEGKRVKQGLLYRGSEMNSHVSVTSQGLDTLRNQMKLKSVMDLRCPKKEEVENAYQGHYINVSIEPYAWYMDDCEKSKEIFQFLANADNYPIYFHCWGGADRTGTLAFLVNAILGVSLEDLIEDYELTSISVWGIRSRGGENFVEFMRRLDAFEGETINQKAVNFLLSSGITKEQIENIRKILL